MPIFTAGKNLTKCKKIPFSSEKEIENLVCNNLQTFLNIELIENQVKYGNHIPDALAFDKNLGSFVLIEFKNKADPGLTDQGFAYMTLVRKHPEFFILKYNENNQEKLKMDDVDWLRVRILFISPEFTKNQEAIDLEEVPFELWRISKYEGNLISFEPIKLTNTEKAHIVEPDVVKRKYEKRERSEEWHLIKPTNETKNIYQKIKPKILSLGDNIRVEPKQQYIAFKAATNFVDIELQKKSVKCHLNVAWGELHDPKNIARNVSEKGHYGNGDYEVNLTKESDPEYFITLVKQAYEKNKN